eukprot:scaffold1616_cov310-Pinguiococcus_pyrenoidosus.AAC.10
MSFTGAFQHASGGDAVARAPLCCTGYGRCRLRLQPLGPTRATLHYGAPGKGGVCAAMPRFRGGVRDARPRAPCRRSLHHIHGALLPGRVLPAFSLPADSLADLADLKRVLHILLPLPPAINFGLDWVGLGWSGLEWVPGLAGGNQKKQATESIQAGAHPQRPRSVLRRQSEEKPLAVPEGHNLVVCAVDDQRRCSEIPDAMDVWEHVTLECVAQIQRHSQCAKQGCL